MTDTPDRWLITFPGPQGCHAQQETAVVQRHDSLGPRGHRLYVSEGGVQVEIAEGGIAYLVSAGGRPAPDTPVHAQPLR
ncbi:DUF6296 family protein [Kitasatospora herbaricolor]|uniref:DUF6296 family protein n=1 Tax=Kitasatospora herbaricolor TaxID=68217 RepID=A0ABZ1W200_9ACTN|nr:DUF6296 family protein [Kitasatospora herbaricolor]